MLYSIYFYCFKYFIQGFFCPSLKIHKKTCRTLLNIFLAVYILVQFYKWRKYLYVQYDK